MLGLGLQALNLSLLLIDFIFHFLEFLDSFPSVSLTKLTSDSMLEVVADDADDQLCLVHPPNMVTKHPQNLMQMTPLPWRTAMHCRPLQHNIGPAAYAHIGPKLLIGLFPERWLMCNNLSGQHLHIIDKGVFGLSGLLRPAIKITDELIRSLS